MSVTSPLLKTLKGHILQAITDSQSSDKKAVLDSDGVLILLCEILELIFRQGLNDNSFSPFGIIKKDYWCWIHEVLEKESSLENYASAIIFALSHSDKVLTSQGKGRLFIRRALVLKILHIPVEHLIHNEYKGKYYSKGSILNDEILGEILLSLILQLSLLTFELNLDNAAFLDDTWELPTYKLYNFPACFDLGLSLGHVNGRSVVIHVDESSITGEGNKLQVGDVITEIFGISIHGWRRSRILSLVNEKLRLTLPFTMKLVKGHDSTGKIFPPLIPILSKLNINTLELEEKFMENVHSGTDRPCEQIGGYHIEYYGSIEVGNEGDVSKIENAISLVLMEKREPILVSVLMAEIGIQAIDIKTKKIILNYSYTEISSCGRRSDMPLYLGFIAG